MNIFEGKSLSTCQIMFRRNNDQNLKYSSLIIFQKYCTKDLLLMAICVGFQCSTSLHKARLFLFNGICPNR